MAPTGGLAAADGDGAPRRVVGDYVVGRTLGAGSVGKVKLGTHVDTGARVALKVIRKETLRATPALAAKVRREIAVLKLLGGAARAGGGGGGGDGVLRLHDVYETPACVVLVLEHCAGGDLFETVIEAGYLGDADAARLFRGVVDALAFAHAHGVAHRDLKLENVLLTGGGAAKLADFGMSGLTTPGSLLETSCGSPNYCAPEVLAGGLYAGPPSDCWSLGVMLYAMVTGGLPFDDDNFARLSAKVRQGDYYLPDAVHPHAAALIGGLLVTDPAARMTLADVSASAWLARHPPAPAPRPPPAPHDPVPRPDRAAVAHLADLGLGACATIARRLSSPRACVEKDFYACIAAFVTLPHAPRGLACEMPPSPPDPDAPQCGCAPVQGGTGKRYARYALPASLAARGGV